VYCLLKEVEQVFCNLQRALFWAGFVEQASEEFLVASAKVIIRLLKAKRKNILDAFNEITVDSFRCSPIPD
jgi:hypothetical protein